MYIYIQLHTSFQRSQKSDILKIDSGPKKKQLKNSKSFCKSQGEEFREPRGSTPKKNSMQRVPLPSFGNGYISHLGQKENHLQNWHFREDMLVPRKVLLETMFDLQFLMIFISKNPILFLPPFAIAEPLSWIIMRHCCHDRDWAYGDDQTEK